MVAERRGAVGKGRGHGRRGLSYEEMMECEDYRRPGLLGVRKLLETLVKISSSVVETRDTVDGGMNGK